MLPFKTKSILLKSIPNKEIKINNNKIRTFLIIIFFFLFLLFFFPSPPFFLYLFNKFFLSLLSLTLSLSLTYIFSLTVHKTIYPLKKKIKSFLRINPYYFEIHQVINILLTSFFYPPDLTKQLIYIQKNKLQQK